MIFTPDLSCLSPDTSDFVFALIMTTVCCCVGDLILYCVAVNKMDQADESCGLDDDETRAYVAEIVTQQLNCPDFKLHPDQVRTCLLAGGDITAQVAWLIAQTSGFA